MSSPQTRSSLTLTISRAAICIASVCAPLAAQESDATAAAKKRCALWREDVAFVGKFLPEKHPNLFHSIEEAAWRAKLDALDRKLAKGTELVTFVADMTEIVASVGDAHTSFAWHKTGFPFLPLRFYEFADGIHVLTFPAKEPRLRQAKLTSVEGIPIDKALERFDRFCAGTPIFRRRQRLTMALVPAMWQAVGLGTGKRLRLGFDDAEGKSFEYVGKVGTPDAVPGKMSNSFDRVHDVWKRRLEKHWYRWMPERGLLHVWFGSCSDGRGFQRMVSKMQKEVGDAEVQAVAVDLRANGGGNSLVISPLYSFFVRKRLRGKIYCIVGRKTFSSAMMNADQMQRNFKAKLVGEDVGGKPGHFGEVRVVSLPQSRLPLQYSTKDFGVDKRREPLRIDHRVGAKAAESFAGTDPILEAVIKLAEDKKR